jgi:sorbitol/mannitol transport system substrate-binding protein
MNKIRFLLSLLVICAFVLGACAAPAAEVAEEAQTPTEVVEEVAEEAVEEAEAPTEVVEEAAEEAEVEEAEEVDPTACNLAAPDEPVEISVIGWSFEIMNFYADEMEKCAEVENIEVNVQMQDFVATKEAFRTVMAAGGDSPFDIMHMANTGINEFGDAGWLLPLNDLVDKYRDEYDLDDISQTGWDGATIDGVIYGIPATANTLHLAYRSDIFEEYGLEVPTTYDEVIEVCEALADVPELDLVFTQDFSAGWAWEIEFLAFIRAHGGDFLNDDNTPAFAGPEGVAAATQMKEVVDACGGDLFLATGYEAAEININTGAQAMVHLWASNTVSMFDPEQSDFADVIKFAPAPAAVEGGPLVGSAWHDFYTIPATTPNDTDLIFRIIMEALDYESQLGAAEQGIVTRMAVSSQGGLPNLLAASETIANGIGIYDPNPAVILAQTALWNWLPFIGTGEMTPQEALDAAAEEYIAEATAQGYLP